MKNFFSFLRSSVQSNSDSDPFSLNFSTPAGNSSGVLIGEVATAENKILAREQVYARRKAQKLAKIRAMQKLGFISDEISPEQVHQVASKSRYGGKATASVEQSLLTEARKNLAADTSAVVDSSFNRATKQVRWLRSNLMLFSRVADTFGSKQSPLLFGHDSSGVQRELNIANRVKDMASFRVDVVNAHNGEAYNGTWVSQHSILLKERGTRVQPYEVGFREALQKQSKFYRHVIDTYPNKPINFTHASPVSFTVSEIDPKYKGDALHGKALGEGFYAAPGDYSSYYGTLSRNEIQGTITLKNPVFLARDQKASAEAKIRKSLGGDVVNTGHDGVILIGSSEEYQGDWEILAKSKDQIGPRSHLYKDILPSEAKKGDILYSKKDIGDKAVYDYGRLPEDFQYFSYKDTGLDPSLEDKRALKVLHGKGEEFDVPDELKARYKRLIENDIASGSAPREFLLNPEAHGLVINQDGEYATLSEVDNIAVRDQKQFFKVSRNPEANIENDFLENLKFQKPPTPANQEAGNALETALENAPDAPPAPANQPIQSSLPENVINNLPPSAPPEPANTRMPNTQVDNIVQSSQSSPVRREGKIRDVEAIQRRQAEIDARRQTAEMVRQRREQVRNARNTSRGNAGDIPLPSQEERFSRFEDHFSRKRRRQQHQERMAAQKEQSIKRKEQQRATKERQRNKLIEQQKAAQQEVRQRRTENRRLSPQQTLEERLENFKAGKRYRNSTLGMPYGNASQNLNRSTFSFDPLSPPVSVNPKTNPVEEVVKKKTPKKPKPANTPTNNVTEATNSVSAPRLNIDGQQKQDVRSTEARARVEQEARDAVENLRLKRQRPQLSSGERAAAKAARESTIRNRRSFKFSPPQAEIKPPTPANIPSSSPPSRIPYRIKKPIERKSIPALDAGHITFYNFEDPSLPRQELDRRIQADKDRLVKLVKDKGIDLRVLNDEDLAQLLLENDFNTVFPLHRSRKSLLSTDGNYEAFSRVEAHTLFNEEDFGAGKLFERKRSSFVEVYTKGFENFSFDINNPNHFQPLAPTKTYTPAIQHTIGRVDETHHVEFKNYDTSKLEAFFHHLEEKGILAKVTAASELDRATGKNLISTVTHLQVQGRDFEHSQLAKEAIQDFFGDNIEYIRSEVSYGTGTLYGKLHKVGAKEFLSSQIAGAKGYYGDTRRHSFQLAHTDILSENTRRDTLAADYFIENNIFEGRVLDVEYAQKHTQVTPPKSQSQVSVQDVPYTPSAKTKERRARKEKALAEKRRILAERRKARAKAKQALKTPKNQPINDPTQAVNNVSTPRPKVNNQQKDTKRNQDRKQNVHEEAQAVSNQGTQASQEAKNAQGNPDAIENKAISAEEQAVTDAPKEAVKDVAEAAQKQKNAAAAAASTNPVEGKAAAEALKDATAELASKGKTALSHAGLAGAGAAGLFALYALSRNSRKEQEIAPRRRHGRVHENPKGYDNGVRSTAVASAALGAVFGFGAIATNKLNPVSRGYLALGAAIGGGILASAANKNADSSSSILGMAGAGAAATLMYALVSKKGTAGLKALKSMLQRQGPKAAVDAAENAVRDIRKTFPMVQRLLSNEGLALGAGLVTLPAAHSIMVKHFANERRSQTDHGDVAFMPAWQDNKAGHTGFRRSNAPLLGLNNASAANVNFSGNVNTYYNSANVFERF